MKKDPLDDDDLIESDEVLRSLTHRAAYRTINVLKWVLLPVAMTLIFIVKDESWNIAGYTVFAVFFLTALIFEVILAYDGVFKGVDELRKNVVQDKRTIYGKVIEIIIIMIVVSLVTGYFKDDDQNILDDLINGIILGVFLSSMYLYRWRHIVDKKSR